MTCSRIGVSYTGHIQRQLCRSYRPVPTKTCLQSAYHLAYRIHPAIRTAATMSRPGRDKLYISETPDEVKNAKGLHLVTQSTPNGQAVQIMLEELADAYGTQWTTTLINIMTNEQKKVSTLDRHETTTRTNDMCRNGSSDLTPMAGFPSLSTTHKIPHSLSTRHPPSCSTSSSMQTRKINSASRMSSNETRLSSGRSSGMAVVPHTRDKSTTSPELHRKRLNVRALPPPGSPLRWRHYTDERIDAINRFKNETLRVYGVLEIHLSGKYTDEPREYLAGFGKGKYSIADIKTWVSNLRSFLVILLTTLRSHGSRVGSALASQKRRWINSRIS